MHLLGGVSVASFMVWAHDRFVSHTSIVFVVALGLLAVGVSWEIFEYFAKAPTEANYIIDTVTDVIMDIVGAGLVIGMYFIWKQK